MTTTPDAPLRSDAARNRAHVLQVARDQLRAGALPPMKDLARLAGVGVGTVYRHFPTQQVLLAEIGAEGTRRLVEETLAAAREEDPAVGFARIVGFVVRGLVQDPAICAALTAPAQGCGPPTGPAAELSRAVELLMARAREAGVVRDDVDGDDVRLLIVGSALVLQSVEADDARTARHLMVLLDGLRPPAH